MMDDKEDIQETTRSMYEETGILIGKGSFGTVLKVKRVSDKKFFARKSIISTALTYTELAYARKEVQLLRKLRHPHIVRFVDSEEERKRSLSYIHVYTEYCEQGDLDLVIHGLKTDPQKYEKFWEPKFLWSTFYQLSEALAYCHDGVRFGSGIPQEEWQTILHGDIKPSNVFLQFDGSSLPAVKLGNFGTAFLFSTGVESPSTSTGSKSFWAPEIHNELLNEKYRITSWSKESDIWALGQTMQSLVECHPLFSHTLEKRDNEGLSYDVLERRGLTKLRTIVNICLRKEPSRRESSYTLVKYTSPYAKLFNERFKNMNDFSDRIFQEPTNPKNLGSALSALGYNWAILLRPLHLAVAHGDEEKVQIFLEMDVDCKKHHDGATAIHVAAKYGHTKLVPLLLSWGADIEAEDWGGQTPLMLAIRNKHDATALILASEVHRDAMEKRKLQRRSQAVPNERIPTTFDGIVSVQRAASLRDSRRSRTTPAISPTTAFPRATPLYVTAKDQIRAGIHGSPSERRAARDLDYLT